MIKTYSVTDSYKVYAKQLIRTDLTLKGRHAYGVENGTILKEDGSVYISYKQYKKVIASFNIKAATKILNGYTIDLLNGLGYLFMVRLGRNPNKPRINKGESFALRKKLIAEGTLTKTNWRVYYTDDEYCRVKWYHLNYLRHINFYEFVSAGGQVGKGLRQLISRTILGNPQLKALYPFIPYKGKGKGLAI